MGVPHIHRKFSAIYQKSVTQARQVVEAEVPKAKEDTMAELEADAFATPQQQKKGRSHDEGHDETYCCLTGEASKARNFTWLTK